MTKSNSFGNRNVEESVVGDSDVQWTRFIYQRNSSSVAILMGIRGSADINLNRRNIFQANIPQNITIRQGEAVGRNGRKCSIEAKERRAKPLLVL